MRKRAYGVRISSYDNSIIRNWSGITGSRLGLPRCDTKHPPTYTDPDRRGTAPPTRGWRACGDLQALRQASIGSSLNGGGYTATVSVPVRCKLLVARLKGRGEKVRRSSVQGGIGRLTVLIAEGPNLLVKPKNGEFP